MCILFYAHACGARMRDSAGCVKDVLRTSFTHPAGLWRSAARIFHTSSQFLAQRRAHLSYIQPASGAAPRASFIHPVSSWRSAARIFHTSSQFLAQRHAHLSYIQPASGAAQPRKRTARTLRIGCPLYGRLPGGVVDAEELPPL